VIGRSAALALLAMAACGPERRSVDWYEAHPAAAAETTDRCQSAAQPGPDCVNAETGMAKAQHEGRMTLYRRAISGGQ